MEQLNAYFQEQKDDMIDILLDSCLRANRLMTGPEIAIEGDKLHAKTYDEICAIYLPHLKAQNTALEKNLEGVSQRLQALEEDSYNRKMEDEIEVQHRLYENG